MRVKCNHGNSIESYQVAKQEVCINPLNRAGFHNTNSVTMFLFCDDTVRDIKTSLKSLINSLVKLVTSFHASTKRTEAGGQSSKDLECETDGMCLSVTTQEATPS